MRKVLVVEDEVAVRRAITRLLNDRGFGTIEAGNGREAIQRLTEETPLAIIIDLFMRHNPLSIYGGCIGITGRVMAFVPGKSACLRCLFPQPPRAE